MTPARQLRFWLIGLMGFGVVLWLLRGALVPFVAAMAIAYFLDPLTDRLESLGFGRATAAATVLIGFGVGVLIFLILLVPLLQAEIADFIVAAPKYYDLLRERLEPMIRRLIRRLSYEDVTRLKETLSGFAGDAMGWLAEFLRHLLTQGMALFDILSILFITPVVAFYTLRDWDRMVAAVDAWLPRRHAPVIRSQMQAIDATLSGYIRGQSSVCLILGAGYALTLSLAGLEFGLVVGLLTGILSFIPYVGSMVGFLLAAGLALGQFSEGWRIALIIGIFLVGQVLEGHVLTPRLVGGKVGLHPVWVMFALLAGGYLFGFLGVLVALPAAAALGVLVRFALQRYLESDYYHGLHAPSPPPDAADLFPAPPSPPPPSPPPPAIP